MLSRPSCWVVGFAFSGVILAGASSTFADFTPIGPSSWPGEKTTEQVLEHIYDQSLISIGHDYIGESVYIQRIQDTLDPTLGRGGVEARPQLTPLDLLRGVSGGPQEGAPDFTTDQLWTADSVSAVARARYALYSQVFGMFDGTSGGSFVPILSVDGSEFNVNGSNFLSNLNGHIWRWGRDGDTGKLTSKNDDNPLDIDHMITYQVFSGGINSAAPPAGQSPTATYILCWEDKRPNDNPDYDYNDMVIEIQVSRASAPEPASSIVALFALGGCALRRRRDQ